MKIVNASDFHVDAATAGFRRFDDVTGAVRQTIEAAIDEKAAYYLFTGDLCDPDGGGDSFLYARFLCESAIYLADNGVRSIWMAGNHDVVESGSGVTTISPLRSLETSTGYMRRNRPMIYCVETPRIIALHGDANDNDAANLLCLPFTSHDRNYDPGEYVRHTTAKLKSGYSDPVIVAGHLNISGIEVGSETTDFPRGRDVFFPQEECADLKRKGIEVLLVNGHYHKKQTFQGIHIPGSVARLTFGDEELEPSYQVIEV